LDAKTLLIASMVALTLVYLTRWFLVARARLAAGGHGAADTQTRVSPTSNEWSWNSSKPLDPP
jgi:hypothetical protein